MFLAWARRSWWVPALYTLAVIWIYRDLWHQHGVATGLGWDTIDTHGPDLDFFASDVAHGRFSLWNPYDKGGYPVFCDPVFDRYYPLNWPFAIWGAVFGTSWWLVQVKVLAHHVIAACLIHAFVRSRGLSLRAAIVSGLGLLACTPLLAHKASNIIWPLAWVPLLWMAVDHALARPSWRRGAALGAALLLPMTAGSPPGLFYAALLVVPYGVLRLVAVLRDPSRRTRAELLRLAATAGTALAIALLVAGVTILPTGQLVELGSRDRFAPAGRDFALALSLPLPAAARGVFVRGAGLFEMYLGVALCMLAVCALVVRPRFDRSAGIVFIATAFAGVWLASGATGGLLPILVDHVPGFGMLRVPGRYKLVAAWSAAAAAGYGVAALEAAWGDTKLRWRAAAVAGAGLVIAIVCIAIAAHPASPKERPAWWSIPVTALAGGLVVAAVWAPRRIADACVAALALFTLLDAPLFTFVLPHSYPAAERRQLHERDALVATLDGVRDRWRMYDEFVLGERAGTRLRVRDFRGYPAVDPISLRRYVDVLDYAKKNPAIITDYNVRYVLDRSHFRYSDATSFVALPNAAFERREPRTDDVWVAKHPAPLVIWYGRIDIVQTRKVLDAVRATEDADGVRRRAVVEPDEAARIPGAPALVGSPPDSRDGALVSYEPDEIVVDVDAPRAGLVVLNEIMFPGWQVTVDGAPATALRANYLLRAVHVGAGKHRIVWRFEPRGWRVLVGGYVLALALIVAAAIAPAVAATARRRRRAPA
jgi:hypothetical protein